MDTENKVLILDNEELVLETIEMFYPSDDITLFTSSSLEDALKILEEEKPEVVVTNIILQDCQEQELIDKLKSHRSGIEVVVMSDLDKFKDTLADFGQEISDVVYKPIDMDILEIIIKRAQKHFTLNHSIQDSLISSNELQDENNNLNTQILELNSSIETLQSEKTSLQDNLNQIEADENSGAKLSREDEKLKSLENSLNKEKNLSNARVNLVISMINAIRKAATKTGLNDILNLFAEAIAKGLKISKVTAEVINTANTAKVKDLSNAVEDKILFLDTANGIEIPLQVGNYLCSIIINEEININDYTYMFHFIKDVINIVSSVSIMRATHAKQLEKEKGNSSNIRTILANIQMYIKKTQAIEKIQHTKDDLTKMSNDILDLVFSALDELGTLQDADKEKVKGVEAKLSIITDEKSQNFDFLSQKIAQVMELVSNIQLGLEGKRMNQVSGDQYLFSDARE